MALNAHDRCDTCRAEAKIRVANIAFHDLMFCGHHYREYAPALAAQGFVEQVDDRDGELAPA